MPAPKGPAGLIEELKKAKEKNDTTQIREILESLAEDKDDEVTVAFIVNSPAGRVVKGLRGHTDEEVRKRAISLTQQWKDKVQAGLEKAEGKRGGKSTNGGEFFDFAFFVLPSVTSQDDPRSDISIILGHVSVLS
jgi:hypothetical protein